MLKIKSIKKQYIISIAIIVLIFIVVLSIIGVTSIRKTLRERKRAELIDIDYEIIKAEGDSADIIVIFDSMDGIDKIHYNYENGNYNDTLSCNGKHKVAMDYKTKDRTTYQFFVEYKDGTSKDLSITFEIPRIRGIYTLKNGLYVNQPDITTGLVPEKTRYLYLDDNGNLISGNWILSDPPENWYDYSSQKWANIYVENEGVESYYIWVPRYCYKILSNERTDIKFINTYNEYFDGITGAKTEWSELEAQGYQIPEAFKWNSQFEEHASELGTDTIIPGYWISKYQLGELQNFTVDYMTIANKKSIEIIDIQVNSDETASKYIFAIDGIISEIKDANITKYTFENVGDGNKVVNVTALNENGEIIGSMTKEAEISKPNEPDLSSLDQDTTFYVYWDENGNEHNEVPITKEAPEEWYNYSSAEWANIVTRNDGLETYFIWIPRYEYQVNQVSQRTYIKFIEGIGTQTTSGYKIPEAFTFDGQELEGFWITKYQLTAEEKNLLINAEMSAGSNLIRIKDITGTLIDEQITNGTSLKYEYYINGNKIHEGTSNTEKYIIEGLNSNTMYTVNIIVRNKTTDEYIGAVTKKIKTVDANPPDISSLNKDCTYYVSYDNNGNEIRTSIKEAQPSNWYDYSNQVWANIVTTANNTETYFIWIPRYEYKILSDRANLDVSNRRVDVTFIPTTITNSNCSNGYEVPEAFTFDGKELTGFWITKYQLSDN